MTTANLFYTPVELVKEAAASKAKIVITYACNVHGPKSEFELAAKVVDQILSITSNDEDALQCKFVAQIKTDRIEDALSSSKPQTYC